LDYTKNPAAAEKNGTLDTEKLSERAKTYLENSGALLPTPIERLAKMNTPAIELYRSNGIDLYTETLEIAVSAQHCNGGLAVKNSRESTTLSSFYAVGECAGTFGVYRPGGSALNSTQTGSLFAAMDIARKKAPIPELSEKTMKDIEDEIGLLLSMKGNLSRDEILAKREKFGRRMSDSAAFLRNAEKIEKAIEETRNDLLHFAKEHALAESEWIYDAMINRDILLTQLVYLSAIRDYIADGGKSRGSYLLLRGDEADLLRVDAEIDTAHAAFVQNTVLSESLEVTSFFEPARPLPESEQWFETVWNRFREKNMEE
jgi:succinate dehydrogenase/fumarate reductase flavoprotein subunit